MEETNKALKVFSGGIMGIAIFYIFSGYSVAPSIDSIRVFLSAKRTEVLEKTKGFIFNKKGG